MKNNHTPYTAGRPANKLYAIPCGILNNKKLM